MHEAPVVLQAVLIHSRIIHGNGVEVCSGTTEGDTLEGLPPNSLPSTVYAGSAMRRTVLTNEGESVHMASSAGGDQARLY